MYAYFIYISVLCCAIVHYFSGFDCQTKQCENGGTCPSAESQCLCLSGVL